MQIALHAIHKAGMPRIVTSSPGPAGAIISSFYQFSVGGITEGIAPAGEAWPSVESFDDDHI